MLRSGSAAHTACSHWPRKRDMTRTLSALVLAIACTLPLCAAASIIGNAASEALIAEGNTLLSRNKLTEALAKYREAAKADPSASSPVACIANVFFYASDRTAPADAKTYREEARSAALAALRIDRDDPMAQEILRHLNDGAASPLHVPNQEATALFNAGEDLYARREYDAALLKYEAAARADPAFSSPWVMAGDCFFVRQQWQEAEARFRKGTEIEALNSQAWRFLSDALAQQGKLDAAEAALFSAIAAHPGQLPSWSKLVQLQHPSLPVTALSLQRKAGAVTDPSSGKTTINLSPGEGKSAGKPELDRLFWISFAMTEALAQRERDADKRPLSTYEVEIKAWRGGMKVAEELMAKGDQDWQDPALRSMARINREGQLEAAVLLLLYKESYRSSLEDWKRRNPSGVRDFIARFGLRP